MDLNGQSQDDRHLVLQLQASIDDAKRQIVEFPPVPAGLSEEKTAELEAVRDEAIQSWRGLIEKLSGAQRYIIDPPPPSTGQEAARARFVDMIIEEVREECPPALADYHDLPFDERVRRTLVALRSLESRAAVGRERDMDAASRGFLKAEIAFLRASREMGVDRGGKPPTGPGSPTEEENARAVAISLALGKLLDTLGLDAEQEEAVPRLCAEWGSEWTPFLVWAGKEIGASARTAGRALEKAECYTPGKQGVRGGSLEQTVRAVLALTG